MMTMFCEKNQPPKSNEAKMKYFAKITIIDVWYGSKYVSVELYFFRLTL